MAVDEVLTDNGPNFVSDAFADLLAERAHPAPPDPAVPAPNERQSRALQPHPSPTSSSTTTSSDPRTERRIRLKRWIHD